MKSIFLKALIAVLFASFVLPSGYELSSQQEPKDKNSNVQQKDRKRLRDGSCDGTYKRKHKKIKKHKKVKKFKKQRKGRG
jgi:hypothetical protein